MEKNKFKKKKGSVKYNDHTFTDGNTKTNGSSDLPRSEKNL